MKFINEIFIDRSLEEVFLFAGEVSNFPLWNYAVIGTEALTPELTGKGAIYKQQRRFLGQTLEDTFILTEYIPNRALTLKSIEAEYPFIVSYSFKPSGNGTVIVNSFELHGKLADGVPGILLRNSVKAAVAKNLQKLKELIEDL